jgi:hypothetical protein
MDEYWVFIHVDSIPCTIHCYCDTADAADVVNTADISITAERGFYNHPVVVARRGFSWGPSSCHVHGDRPQSRRPRRLPGSRASRNPAATSYSCPIGLARRALIDCVCVCVCVRESVS